MKKTSSVWPCCTTAYLVSSDYFDLGVDTPLLSVDQKISKQPEENINPN